jgi:hypothetical protein
MHTRSSYICIHGSLSGISFFLTCFIGRNNLLHVNSNPWILQEVYLEQAVFIVFSLLLEESLNLVMLSFISLFHIFYTLFFIITSISSARLFLSGFKPSWESCDSRYNSWLFLLFFLSWNLHVLPYVSL